MLQEAAYRHKWAALLSLFLMGNGFGIGYNSLYAAADFFIDAFPVRLPSLAPQAAPHTHQQWRNLTRRLPVLGVPVTGVQPIPEFDHIYE
jgi:hypothetical protein